MNLRRHIRQAIERFRGPTAPSASPLELLADAPAQIAGLLVPAAGNVVPLPPSSSPKLHWMYLIGNDRVLHVYGAAGERIRRSLTDRAEIQEEIRLPGIPAIHALADEGSRLWLLEDRLHGSQPRVEAAGEWFPEVRDWLVQLGGPVGPPLETTAFWDAHVEESIALAPPELHSAIARAWTAVARIGARTLHGDVQPRNLVRNARETGLVDWEGVWRYGLPGLDLVFLAMMTASRRPDTNVIEALARGNEPPDRPLQAALHELGIGNEMRPAALIAMMATWSLRETRRAARGGARGRRGETFRSLLRDSGSRLASMLR